MAEDKLFQEKLPESQAAVISSAVYLLAGEAKGAAETLSEIHRNEEVNAAVRVQAARAVLSELVEVRDNYEFQTRLSAIEETLEKSTN